MQVSNGGSPEDAVGGGEIEAAPVRLLHVAHTHVNEGDSDAQMVLLAGRWERVRARPRGWGSRPEKWQKGEGGGTLGSRNDQKGDKGEFRNLGKGLFRKQTQAQRSCSNR